MRKCKLFEQRISQNALVLVVLICGSKNASTYHFSNAFGEPMQKPVYLISQNGNSKTLPPNVLLKSILPILNERREQNQVNGNHKIITEIAEIKLPLNELTKELKFHDKMDDDDDDYVYTKDSSENDYVNEDYVQKNRPVYSDSPSSIDAEQYPDVVGRYKVVEKIPDDTRYVPPKSKVVPIPAPCIRSPPRHRPNTPKPPSLKTYGAPHSKQFPYTTSGVRFPNSRGPAYPKSYLSYPYVIKKYYAPSQPKNLIIRHKTAAPKRVREVHIHHHHTPVGFPIEMHIHKSIGDGEATTPAQNKRLEMVLKEVNRYQPNLQRSTK